TATGVVIAITAGTDSIIYTATNSCGTARSAWGLTVLPLPVAGTLSSRTNICVFDTTLVVSSVSGGTYTSSNTAVATVSATGVVTARSAGTTTINYSVTNTCGTAVATRTITVLAQPVVTVTPPAPQYCIGDNVNLNATGAVSFTWSGSVGLSATTGGNVTASPTTTVTYSVIGTDANSCRDTATVTVTVNPLPVVVVPDITICQGSSGILTASGAVNYTWTPAATLSGSTGASVGAFPTDTTLYTVTGTDANGCVNTTTVRVNVNRIPPPPGVKAIDTLCLNEVAAPLTATGTGLLWYTSPTPGTGSAIAPTPPTAGVGSLAYWVSQTVDGCESPLQPMVVNVLVNAITGFTYNIHYGCNGDTITFTNQSQFCDRYVWHFGDDQLITSIEVNPVHAYPTVRTPTSFTIKLNGYNDICFDDSTTQVVVLQPTPHLFQLSVSPDQVIDLGGSAQLDAQGAVIYHWGPHDGSLSDPNINNPVATPQETTVYTVYGYDHNGCFDTANVTVRVITEDSTVIPNAFTPNKDGRNDIFRVLPPRGGRLVELSVFNRWGELVYHGNTGEMGWDGTYNGEPQDIGTYSYLAVLSLSSGTLQTRKGMVTLIR
ncbi:MAG: hypothetical protein EBZ77_04240, partial [Chitinophagia bacterium]|nr:hypothetical protein [Chitinophagia bacterium]